MSRRRVSSFDEQAWAKGLGSLQIQQKILWDLDEKVLLANKCNVTGFSVSHRPWWYPKDHDDGTPVERHDASILF